MSLTFWIRKQWTLAVMFVACAAIIGWPFSALVGVSTARALLHTSHIWSSEQAPLALHLLIEAGIVKLISSAVLSLVLFMGPSIVVDYFYYQKPVIAMWNILTYNVFNANTGPDLYGVEPWYYYLLNGFLNFNIVLGLALLSVPVSTKLILNLALDLTLVRSYYCTWWVVFNRRNLSKSGLKLCCTCPASTFGSGSCQPYRTKKSDSCSWSILTFASRQRLQCITFLD